MYVCFMTIKIQINCNVEVYNKVEINILQNIDWLTFVR